MLQLPQSCYSSELRVFPKNWQSSKASCKKDWYVYYRFYDPNVKPGARFQKGKLVLIKGMNRHKTTGERQKETRLVLQTELDKLLRGYNPIQRSATVAQSRNEISTTTPFLLCLQEARVRIKGSSSTHRDLRSILGFITEAATRLRYSALPINCVKRKHIKAILTQIELQRGESAHRYNKVRSYLMILFNELVELEVVDFNPAKDVSKKTHVHKLRRVLNPEQRKRINAYLQVHHQRFWLFLHIFFHSGARLTELLEVQRKQVNLQEQYFVVTVRKGRQAKEVIKPIKDVALPFWKLALHGRCA